jgi:hypothetical protein
MIVPKWKQLELWICEQFKELDIYAKRTPGSGNKGRKGDIFNSLNLNVEAKCYQKKNVWDVKWLEKCESEIPLHSDKIAIVVTENKDGKKHVHLTFDDFWTIYKRSLKNV